MYRSVYQQMKPVILHFVGLSRDSIHVHIGLTVFFLSVALWRKGRISLISVVPVMVVAGLMEALDLYDDFRSVGSMHWLNSLHDLVNTILWPLVIVALAKLRYAFRPES